MPNFRLAASTRVLLWLLLCAWAMPAAADHAEVTLRIHHFLGEESLPHVSLMEPWAKRVAQDSQGRIAVEIHPAMTLGGKAQQLIGQVRSGTVDIVWTAAAYTPGRFPYTDVFSLPLVHRGDPVATNLAIHELLDAELAPDFQGLHPLLVHVHQGHAFHLGKQRVMAVGNFQNLVLRPPGRGIGAWTIEALGAETTKKRHPKLAKALAANKLDGALMSFNLAESMGVIEAAGSHTLLTEKEFFGTSIYLFLMNERRYNELPVDLQAIIDRHSGRGFAREMGEVWQTAGEAGMAAARKLGKGIDVLRDEEARQARARLEDVAKRWLQQRQEQRIDGARLIRKARMAVQRNTQH